MNNRLWILGIVAAIAALAVVKSMEPRQFVRKCLLSSSGRGHRPRRPHPRPRLGRCWKRQARLVLAHSDMCQQCQQMSKIAADVVPDFKDNVQFLDVKVDSPSGQPLAKKLKDSVIPTSIFLDANGKEVERKVGLIPAGERRRKLSALSGEK